MNNDRYPSLSQPDEENNLDSILKRSNGPGFKLEGLLSGSLSGESSSDKKSDSSKEKTSKKKKKDFPTLLKDIFPKTLDLDKQPPTILDQAIPEKPQVNEVDDLQKDESGVSEVAPQPVVETDFSGPATSEATIDSPAIDHHASEGKLPDLLQESDLAEDTEEYAKPENTESAVETVSETEEVIEDIKDPIVTKPITQVTPVPPAHAPPIFPHAPIVPPVSPTPTPYGGGGPGFNMAPVPGAGSVVTEKVIIEKHKPAGAVLAFLGAEFLSRRRDKKLKAEIHKQSKESKKSFENVQSQLDKTVKAESVESIIRRQQRYQSRAEQQAPVFRNGNTATSTVSRNAESGKTPFEHRTLERGYSGVIQSQNRSEILPTPINYSQQINNERLSTVNNAYTFENVDRTKPPYVENTPEFVGADSNSYETRPENQFRERVAGNSPITTSLPVSTPSNTPATDDFTQNYNSQTLDNTNLNNSTDANTNAIKQSAQIGVGVAILILAIFAIIYIL